MKYCFDNGRFAHGFYVIKEGDTIVATLGLDNFKGWGVITRYLRHDNDTMVRGMLGLFIYFISQNLNANITGLCSTQNIDQRDLMAVKARLLNKRMERYPSNNTIFHATADVMQNCKKLDYNVNYRNTIQEVYTYYTNKIPPFERAYKAP